MKDVDWFEFFIGVALVVMAIGAVLPFEAVLNTERIKELEQINAEQAEEKEMYRQKCEQYEEWLLESGQVVDECECN